MRYISAAAVIAVSIFTACEALGQGPAPGLSVTDYQLVREDRVSRTVSDFTYRAELTNNGPARNTVTATVASTAASAQVIQGTVHFSNVPANGKALSTDTFTLRIDRSVVFTFASLQWTFAPPAAPVANAGADRTAAVGTTVTLNGSQSTNPSGVGTLTYSWAFTSRPSGSTAVLANPTSVTPSFVVDVAGSYTITLTVSNGVGTSTDSVVVSTTNTAPVARAGDDKKVAVGATVVLSGSGSSDVDGDPLTYAWILITRPAGSIATLTGAGTVSPSFVADKAGTYVAQLIVNDGKTNSAPDSVTITTENTVPVANPGAAQMVNVGAVVQLNGAGSTDMDGDPLTYQWMLITVPSGSTATLSSTTAVNPTFVADRPGTYVAQLIVNDGKVNSIAKTVTITTNAVQAPTANAGPAQTVKHGSLVTLSGSGTDPQGRPLTFQWSLTTKPANSTAVLSSTTSANPTFVADLPGTYVAQLIVNNGFSSSAPATVTITTTNSKPVAEAGPNQNITAGSLVTLNGSGSSDADLDPLTYSFTFSSRPAGSTATLSAATSPSPTFIADLPGTYVVQLIVKDPFEFSNADTVTITVASPGQIVLPATTSVALGQSAPFPVQLSSPAGIGGVTITLSTSDSTKVSLSTTSVVIPQGATQPATQPQVTGVNVGSATITASAAAYTSKSTPVQVNATVAFTAPTLTIVRGTAQNLTLTLSAPAPAGGLTIAVSSSNTGVATVPPTVTIPANGTTTNVPVAGVAAGTAVITASGTNIPNATATITVVAPLTISTTSLPQGQVGVSYSQSLAVAGGTQPYTFALISGTLPAGLNFNTTNGLISGTPTAPVSNRQLNFRVTDSTSPAQITTANLTLTIVQGAPSSVTATTGGGQTATVLTAFANPLSVTVKDSQGNPVSGVTVTFTVPGSGARATFAGGANTAVTNASGVATSAVLTANNLAGTFSVSASVAGVATPATFSLTNRAGAAASIAVSTGSGQSAAINTAFAAPLAAIVKDAQGNPVSGVSVTFTAPATGARGTFAGGINTAVTNASGIATSGTFTANNVIGSYTVAASVAGVAQAASFSLTNTVGPPASVTATSGSGQNATVNTPFTAPLVATVRDSAGNPLSGVTVTFTAPASGARGTFAGGVNTAVTNASGVATSQIFTANGTAGSYVVTASVAGVAQAASFSLTNVAVQSGPALSITGATVGQNLQTPVTLTLPQPAPAGGLNVTITSSNPALVRVAGRPGDAGATQVVIPVGEGLSVAAGIYVQGFAASGTAQLTASAPGFSNGTSTITLAPSGFVIAGPNGIGVPSFSVPQGVNTPLTVSAARLSSTFNFVQVQAVRAGTSVVVPVSVVPSSAGTVTPANVTIAGGDSSATTTFRATATGSATITAGVPAGFSTPAQGANSVVANITPANLVASNVTVGENLQTTTFVGLNSPAPGGLVLTITSNDPAKVLFSKTQTAAGSASISFTLEAGRTATPEFYVQGLDDTGSVTYTAVASGYGVATGTVTLTPSGFVLSSPQGRGQDFITTTGAPNIDLSVQSARLNPSRVFVELQEIRGGLNVAVNVVSSDPTVGSIVTSPLQFSGGTNLATTEFDPIKAGSTTIQLNTPTGFTAPLEGSSLTATVIQPTLQITDQLLVGRNLQETGFVLLGQPAPAGGVSVTLTSNSGNLLLSTSPTAAGSASIVVTIGANQSSATYYVQSLASSGTATYTATAAGYTPRTSTVVFAPSGVVVTGPFGVGFPLVTKPNAGIQPVTVSTVVLGANNERLFDQSLAGGLTLTAQLSNSNPAVGTVTTPVTITGGSASNDAAFTPLAVGETNIAVLTPAGYTTSTTDTVLLVRVVP